MSTDRARRRPPSPGRFPLPSAARCRFAVSRIPASTIPSVTTAELRPSRLRRHFWVTLNTLATLCHISAMDQHHQPANILTPPGQYFRRHAFRLITAIGRRPSAVMLTSHHEYWPRQPHAGRQCRSLFHNTTMAHHQPAIIADGTDWAMANNSG